MGTSASSSGPGSGSPLVPPWADPTPDAPLPKPDPQRFREFRTALGKYVGGGDRRQLGRALGHYASRSTGGATIGSRRYGSMSTAGGRLVNLLSDLQGGGTGEESIGVDLSRLKGASTDYAIQEIALALAPDNGDRERIINGLQAALSHALEGSEAFEPEGLSEDVLVDVLLSYLTEVVFEQIILDSDRAFEKTEDPELIVQREGALFEVVKASVDKHLHPLVGDDIGRFSTDDLAKLQRDAIKEIWEEWDSEAPE